MTNTLTAEQLASAKQELAKLPLLGPAAWLFARDQRLRFTFMADLDWRLLPPLVLDQCRLYNKHDLPWAFCTWAFVNDAVHERLRSSAPVIAPHEWRSGEHAWLIDVVAPFGDAETIATEACAQFAAGRTVHAWMPMGGNLPTLRTFAPEVKGG
jgi:cytolysin-activating lysine-acyltransferase